jgi:hypothetical protein
MRYSQMVGMFAVLFLVGWPAFTIDQPPEGDPLRNTAGVNDQENAGFKDYGVMEETPNQRRQRLGEEIIASYQPSEKDYGERVLTPNELRKQMGKPTPWEEAQGVEMETPNDERARLESSVKLSVAVE